VENYSGVVCEVEKYHRTRPAGAVAGCRMVTGDEAHAVVAECPGDDSVEIRRKAGREPTRADASLLEVGAGRSVPSGFWAGRELATHVLEFAGEPASVAANTSPGCRGKTLGASDELGLCDPPTPPRWAWIAGRTAGPNRCRLILQVLATAPPESSLTDVLEDGGQPVAAGLVERRGAHLRRAAA